MVGVGAIVGDPRKFFESDYLGRKGLLAFLGHRLSENEIDAGQDFATYVRVARVREELRSRIFVDTLRTVHSAWRAPAWSRYSSTVPRMRSRVYSQPLVRHNHGIDLLLRGGRDRSAGERAVTAAGFRLQRTDALSRGVLKTYRHASGLELTMRSRLYLTPHVENDPADFGRAANGFRWASLEFACSRRPTGSATRSQKAPHRPHAAISVGFATPTSCFAAPSARFRPRSSSPLCSSARRCPTALLLEFFRAGSGSRFRHDVVAELRDQRCAARRGGLESDSVGRIADVDVGRCFLAPRARPPLLVSQRRILRSVSHRGAHRLPATPVGEWKIPWLYAARAGRLVARPFRRLRTLRAVAS